jgi:DNA repair protein RecO (recombination protein O)
VSLITARAVLLRSHPYSESSRVLRFLTDRHGLVGVMAKGVRRPRSAAEGLDLFAEGSLSYYHKDTRDLQTLNAFDVGKDRRGLGGDPRRLAAAAVVAELVLRHAGEADGGGLFDAVSGALDALACAGSDEVGGVLLREGWGLVSGLGYRPDPAMCVVCERVLAADELARMDFAQGGLRCAACSGSHAGPRVGPGARAQLAALLGGTVPDPLTRPRAHLQLLSDFVTYHLAGTRPLEAFRVLATLLPADDA